MTAPIQKNPNYSTGFIIPDALVPVLANASFVNLKNGNTQITVQNAQNNPDSQSSITTSIKAGGTSIFQTPGNNAGTVSYKGAGTAYFATGGQDTTTSVTTGVQAGGQGAGSLKVSSTSTTSNQTVGNKIANLTSTDWLYIGGAVVAAVLLYVLAK